MTPAFAPAPAIPAGERFVRATRATTQAQLIVGVPGLRRDHPDQWVLSVLNAVLGDGMSSRLFLEVREERGLAYDVGSSIVSYADAGVVSVYAGVDPAKIRPTIAAVLDELARLRDVRVPDAEMDKVKAYLGGRLELRLDETRYLASWIGTQEALHDRVMTPDEALAAIEAVTAEQVADLAGRLFHDEGLRLAVVAPAGKGRALARDAADPGLPMSSPATDRAASTRGADLRIARLHLRGGSHALARAELEALAGRDDLDRDGILDLAEVRWRTGDLAGAGVAAAAWLEDGDAGGESGALAHVISAEAAAAGAPRTLPPPTWMPRPPESATPDPSTRSWPESRPARPGRGKERSPRRPRRARPPRSPGRRRSRRHPRCRPAGRHPRCRPRRRSPLLAEPRRRRVAAGASLSPSAASLLAAGTELLDEAPARAAIVLALALRADRAAAEAVLAALDAATPEPDPVAALAFVRAEALRAAGRHDEARIAYASAERLALGPAEAGPQRSPQ